ncbi:MAG: pantoate--beta-alanine ligase [Anaerovoracaceae bacterium]
MQIVETIAEVRAAVRGWRKQGCSVGLVPTMGYLHDGHGSLIERSAAENDRTIVSIFVNPMQFSPGEDLEDYPRDLRHDAEFCRERGASLIFHPTAEEMYGDSFYSYVDMTTLTETLCGGSRPRLFRGVCTVVSKLFHITGADRAYFGKKDAQQLAVIRRMVRDLNFDIEIVGCESVREADGLAMSSRNSYLSEEERAAAPRIYRSLRKAREQARQGRQGCPAAALQQTVTEELTSEPLLRPEYISIVDRETMQPVDTVRGDGSALLAVAVRLGRTRLIDNIEL